MTTLKELTGLTVQTPTTDPNDPTTGQIWYNRTVQEYKGYGIYAASGAWSTGNYLNLLRFTLGGTGTQTAALAIGGYAPSVPGFTGATEEYDGTNWTT